MHLHRVLRFLIFLCAAYNLAAQKKYFGDEPVIWGENSLEPLQESAKKYELSDLVILNDKTDFFFFSSNNEKLIKNVTVKINTENGKDVLEVFKIPESFDYALDACLYKQGRNARIKTPFISEFHLKKFAARKYEKGKWTPVVFDYKYEPVNWISRSGEFLKDELIFFKFNGLKVGDVVEITYELQFNSDYGSNIFYFNSQYPKVNCEYSFFYKTNKYLSGFSYVLPIFVADSCIERDVMASEQKDYLINVGKIKLKNLKPINYPANSFEGKSLPHVYVDFNFYRIVTGSYSTNNGRAYETQLIRARNFEWMIFRDTTNNYTKIYDKHFANLRKFIGTLPPLDSDSTHKFFFKALCDTFNNYRFISANQLFYNESNLYNLSSSDHLLKRRIVGSQAWKLYQDILNDTRVFYYTANVQDRRYGEHSPYYRAHYAYERNLFTIPSGDSYIYFMTRYSGVKYHLNELPFYFEGVTTALSPRNFQDEMKDKDEKFHKFIKTHKGTFNENTRTENVTVKISLDSLKTSLAIKESLSGQFSTVLRHLYLNDHIDSTIAPYYFKKCTDKPSARDVRIKLSSRITDFPFRYTFNCSENIRLQSNKYLDLKNWFSFVLGSFSIPEKPSHDYYIDFDFSDAYNFLLDFGSPVEITNISAFSKNINNDFFELESQVVKNSDASYLLKVKVAVKERRIQEDKLDLLMEMVKNLDEINNFSLVLERK